MAYSVEQTFKGTDFNKVNEDVEKYFQYYDPRGYGTSIERTEYRHENGVLVKIVVVSRYNSCD